MQITVFIDEDHESSYPVPENGDSVHVWVGEDCGGWKSYRRLLQPEAESAAVMEKRILDGLPELRRQKVRSQPCPVSMRRHV